MAKKEAEVHGIRIKETRADRTFNVLNLIFWMIVLFTQKLNSPVKIIVCFIFKR